MHLIKTFILHFVVSFLYSRANNHFQASDIVVSSWKAHRPWAHRAWRINNPVEEILWEMPGSVGTSWLLVPVPSLSPLMVTYGVSGTSVLKTTSPDRVTGGLFPICSFNLCKRGTLFCSLLCPQHRRVSGTSQGSKYFIYIYDLFLFLAVLGLCCCVGFSLVAASGRYSLVAVHRLLTAVAPLVAEHWL